jgi:murein DD-endopeptidase MepM/ murein hydrolase activator NlpD
MIDHGYGLNSSFLHLSRVLVKVGDPVSQGQVVGEVGATGRVTGAHLDWRMNWFDQRVDPQLLVGTMPEAANSK